MTKTTPIRTSAAPARMVRTCTTSPLSQVVSDVPLWWTTWSRSWRVAAYQPNGPYGEGACQGEAHEGCGLGQGQ
jgi:hypothetical protein